MAHAGHCCSSCAHDRPCESTCPGPKRARKANVRQHAPLGDPPLRAPKRTVTETQLRGELRAMLKRGRLPTNAPVKFWSRKEESGASARDHAYVYTNGASHG